MEEGARRRLLRMSAPQLADVARFCNRFPSINVRFEVAGDRGASAQGGGDAAAPPAAGAPLGWAGGASGARRPTNAVCADARRAPTARPRASRSTSDSVVKSSANFQLLILSTFVAPWLTA
jgi:hypothetical protein